MINRYKFGDTPWLIEGIEDRLKALIAEHHSNKKIAEILSEEFHLSLSRNAVIGRRQRSGLAPALPRPIPRLKSPPLVNHGNYFKFRKGPGHPSTAPKERKPKSGDHPHRCSIMELSNKTCRWPVGDPHKPNFFYCGAPEADSRARRPYCPEHNEMAWRK